MMVRWRQGLDHLDARALQHAVDAFNSLTDHEHVVNDHGRVTLRKLIRKHGPAEVLEAISVSGTQYIAYKNDGQVDVESVGLAFSKIGGICRGKNMSEDERQLFYIRGICRNRFDRCIDWQCIKLLREVYEGGASIEYLKQLARDTDRWWTWESWMLEVLEEQRAEREFPGWRHEPDLAVKRGAKLGVVATDGETLDSFVSRVDRAVAKLYDH